MPRRRSAPRLYLDKKRRTWIIRDGAVFRRTGCAESDAFGAERQLIEYLASKHKPGQGAEDPLILDILLAYASQHLPDVPFNSRRNATYSIADLSVWWKAERNYRGGMQGLCGNQKTVVGTQEPGGHASCNTALVQRQVPSGAIDASRMVSTKRATTRSLADEE
jgi:hypothetical protein